MTVPCEKLNFRHIKLMQPSEIFLDPWVEFCGRLDPSGYS